MSPATCIRSVVPSNGTMTTTLSKSKYLAGCQCPKRLWLQCFSPELAVEQDPSVAARLEVGTEIGRHARALFPGCVLVDEEAWRHGKAGARTQELLTDSAVPAIFEPAFVHAGVRIRVDVLERLSGGAWGLREVKSGTGVKEVHLHDVAVQRFVLEGAGLRVPSVEIIHVDGTYVRGNAGIDWQAFFKRADVTSDAEPFMKDVPARVEDLHRILGLPNSPAIEPDRHCSSPYECEFWEYCTRDKPEDWIFYLPANPERFEALRAAGIERIVGIPNDFPLTGRQERVRSALRSGKPFISPDLAQALDGFGPPADHLDFETVNPDIPLYPGTRPYEHIPFQWSLHRVEADGHMEHHKFLASGSVDPRREFAETLLAALGGESRPIIVYSSFEARVLGGLASALPDLAQELNAVKSRLRDLLPVVRRHVYHGAFRGMFSLKAVAPALVAGFGYDDLEQIADGRSAGIAFLRLAQGELGSLEEEEIRGALLAYCERDTMALVELHRAMREWGRSQAQG